MSDNSPLDQDIIDGFTKGLLSGYAGNTQLTSSQRASFPIMLSHLEENGYLYHDEWLKAHTGGGQELLKIHDKLYTRLYAGGTVTKSELENIGITEEDVIQFLIQTLTEVKHKTRLFDNCEPIENGDWKYHYQILQSETHIPLTIGKETIHYKNQVVFVHSFFICEVRL